jgi:hypothetical protein
MPALRCNPPPGRLRAGTGASRMERATDDGLPELITGIDVRVIGLTGWLRGYEESRMKPPTELCVRCGNRLTPRSVFCSQCGSPATPEESAAEAASETISSRNEAGPAATGLPATGEISWEVNTPLLTNQFIMYDLVKVWGFSSLFLGLLMAGIAVYDRNWRTLANMAPVVGAVSAGLLVLLILVMLVLFGNRFPMGFRLGPQGAMVVSLSRRGRWGNRLAVILGALAGKPGVAGAGLLGMAQETVAVVWDDVRRLNIHAPARVISLMDSWHVVLRLYCTPQNYEVVLSAVQKWAAKGVKIGADSLRVRGSNSKKSRIGC